MKKKNQTKVKKNIQVREVRVSKRISKIPQVQLSKCIKHTVQNQFFCLQCKQLTCAKCIISQDHSAHADKQIDLEDLQNSIHQPEDDLVFKQMQKDVQKQESRIQDTEKKIIEQVNGYFKQIYLNIHKPLQDYMNFKTQKQTFLQQITKSKLNKNNTNQFILSYQQNNKLFNQTQQKTCKKKKLRALISLRDLDQDNNGIQIEERIIEDGLNDILDNNIIIQTEMVKVQSSIEGQLKYLHWFEWSKRKLTLYELSNRHCDIVDLNIQFKIPSFSRSIMFSRTSQIFLFGGEEPEFHPRRDVYMFDLHAYRRNKNNKLTQCAKMPIKKFDFTLVELNSYIYILSGKNSLGEIANTCHKYDPINQNYKPIANLKHPRYASSAAAIHPNIFLFGGRGNIDNQMIKQIEIYNVITKTWVDLRVNEQFYGIQEGYILHSFQDFYVPVEVCGCVAVSSNEILLFGGCSNDIKDQNKSFIFNTETNQIIEKKSMVLSQVFVTPPFIFGRNVYAIGNEYYLKQRSLHKYNLDKNEWQILI